MRPPTFDPTRISLASTVPEPCNDESRENQPSEYASPATIAANTTTMITTRLPIRFSYHTYDFASPKVTGPDSRQKITRSQSRPRAAQTPSTKYRSPDRCVPRANRLHTPTTTKSSQTSSAETHAPSRAPKHLAETPRAPAPSAQSPPTIFRPVNSSHASTLAQTRTKDSLAAAPA